MPQAIFQISFSWQSRNVAAFFDTNQSMVLGPVERTGEFLAPELAVGSSLRRSFRPAPASPSDRGGGDSRYPAHPIDQSAVGTLGCGTAAGEKGEAAVGDRTRYPSG